MLWEFVPCRLFSNLMIVAATVAISLTSSAQHNPYEQIHSFGNVDQMTAHPTAPLLEGSDGVLYGTAYTAGSGDVGAVFRVNKDGSGFKVLRAFSEIGGDAQNPAAGLVENSVGLLYGTTIAGGMFASGTVFKIGKDGGSYEVLHSFPAFTGDGKIPYGGMIIGEGGTLYGTTSRGGPNDAGTVFKINPDGTGYAVLRPFYSTNLNGAYPQAALLHGSDGLLYGTTFGGGQTGLGTVFRLNAGGTNYVILHSFTGTNSDGANPRDALIEGRDGLIYGTTENGGENGFGAIFRSNKDGSNYAVIHSFDRAGSSGAVPGAPLFEGQDGTLYGTASSGGDNGAGTVFRLNHDGSGFRVLHSFSFAADDAINPHAALIQARDGLFYSTASGGGPSGDGAIFRVAGDGTQYEITHTFSNTGGDGRFILASIAVPPDGQLYGTTQLGGRNGRGTIYKLAPDGSGYAIIHSFGDNAGDGAEPHATLTPGPGGMLFGTTYLGGANDAGTLFKMDTDGGGFTVLHDFLAAALDGGKPEAQLIVTIDGLVYGTTAGGGTDDFGTIFKLDSNGGNYSILHHFAGGTNDGKYPESGLTTNGQGVFFGTTANGGAFGAGTVFRINTDGSIYQTLHDFNTNEADGIIPKGTILLGSDGWLYGMTRYGGAHGLGMIYRLQQDGGGYAQLRSFSESDGNAATPEAGLAEGPDGALYGMTYNRGGAIFRMNKDGSGFSIRHVFTSGTGDGVYPVAQMVNGPDGLLYGTTEFGGAVGFGTIFRITLDALFAPHFSNSGTFSASFIGKPGMKWSIQRAPSVSGPWNGIGSLTPNSSGLGQLTDTNSPAQRSFYRMVFP